LSTTAPYIIEIATTDFTTTKAAVAGGADRIELCAALAEGGTTPTYGTIRQCRESFDVPLFPIIRPRSGDFFYSDEEYQIMLYEIRVCKDLGCDGVVIGLLQADGSIDLKRTSGLIHAAYPMEVTFHRAFDRCLDPYEALEQLISVGCQRILTSGQQPTVMEGIETLTALVEKAADRIIIMPGSGVRKENIKILAEQTKALEFHSSLRGKQASSMEFLHPAFVNSAESYTNPSINPEEVKALRNALFT
jgi:copper homeostasis protein